MRRVEDGGFVSVAQSSSLRSDGQPREVEREEKQQVYAESEELCAQLVGASVCGGRWRALEGAGGRGEPWNCRGALARRLDESQSPRCHHPIDKHMASCSRTAQTQHRHQHQHQHQHQHPPTARARRVTSVNIDLHVLHDPYDSHKFGGETPRATSLPAPTTCTPPPPSWTGSTCQFQWRHTRPHTSSTTSPSSSYLAWGPPPRPSSSHPHQCTMCSPGGRAPGPAPR